MTYDFIIEYYATWSSGVADHVNIHEHYAREGKERVQSLSFYLFVPSHNLCHALSCDLHSHIHMRGNERPLQARKHSIISCKHSVKIAFQETCTLGKTTGKQQALS